MVGARLGIEGIGGEKPERCAVIFHILIADDEDMIGRPVTGGDAAARPRFAIGGIEEMRVADPFTTDPLIEHISVWLIGGRG
jgi:hypothetical protein